MALDVAACDRMLGGVPSPRRPLRDRLLPSFLSDRPAGEGSDRRGRSARLPTRRSMRSNGSTWHPTTLGRGFSNGIWPGADHVRFRLPSPRGPDSRVRTSRRVTGMVANVHFTRDVEDTAVAVLQFESGGCATVSVTHAAEEPRDTIEVFGSRGLALRRSSEQRRPEDSAGRQLSASNRIPRSANLHLPLIEDFVDAVVAGRTPGVPGEIGREVARLEAEIYERGSGPVIDLRRCVVTVVLTAVLACSGVAADRIQPPSTFAQQITALSEPEGYFDTDNLISNESSYQQVLPELRRTRRFTAAPTWVSGRTRTSHTSRRRALRSPSSSTSAATIFCCTSCSRRCSRSHVPASTTSRSSSAAPCPPRSSAWRAAPVDRLVSYVDAPALRLPPSTHCGRGSTPPSPAVGVTLSAEDLRTIDRFHRRFIEEGVSLRFQSTGRPPRSYYPTYRRASDRHGWIRPSGQLPRLRRRVPVSERSPGPRQVIPVVGDLSGPSAIAAIGKLLGVRRIEVSAFYVSNVEFYLFGEGAFPRYITNLGRLPHAGNSVIIRSVFGGFAGGYRPGDSSVSRLQSIDELLTGVAAGKIQYYGDLVGR